MADVKIVTKGKKTLEELQKFIKQSSLTILSIEDDSTDNAKVLKLNLPAPITATGSNLFMGEKLMAKEDHIFVAGDEIEKFLEGVEEVDDHLEYKGSMKIDVSKPNGRTGTDGTFEITKASKLWLTSVSFSKKGQGMRAGRADSMKTAYKAQLEQLLSNADKNSNVAAGKPPVLNVVADTVK